jgi:hypothetical protein
VNSIIIATLPIPENPYRIIYPTPCANIMDELEQLQETIFHEIQRTEKAMHDTDLREDTDRGMPRIDTLNWVLNEILVLKREEEI